MVQEFGIIGGGSWATALVKILTDNKHKVNWWIRNEKTIEHIRTRHHNPHYIQSVNFDVALLSMSANLEHVIRQSVFW
jgi:glycerol-3-phosphate dehydrogenase (NAD(P)+)